MPPQRNPESKETGTSKNPNKMDSTLLASISGFLLALAWMSPGTWASAIAGWLFVLCLCASTMRSGGSYVDAFIAGVLALGIAIRWLYHTISYFGGISPLPSMLLMGIFTVLSALQFVLFVFFYRNLPQIFRKTGMGLAVAWVCAEFIFPGLFPWFAGHTQISFLPFAQIADIAGVQLISFMMFWASEQLLSSSTRLKRVCAFSAFVLCLIYGLGCIVHYSKPAGPLQPVAVIQANISIEDKHNAAMIQTNVKRYVELSNAIQKPGTLIIWPESVVTEAIYDKIQNASQSRTLSFLPKGSHFIVGALSFESRDRYFNSALGISPDGSMLPPYHKRILMPFGEFTPFSKRFPWLKELNPTAGDFSSGTKEAVFEFKNEGESAVLKVSPLICYEDLVPSMARDSVRAGAEVLVNLTNDAWYGDSDAPFQHHLIASFRAIENRRFLVRSTNTGFSAIVDPLGRTLSSIPVFSEGTIESQVTLLRQKTLYTAYLYNFPFQLLFAFICIGILYRFLRSLVKR